jgi:transcriptional regulator with XRE-family HTH domain
MLERIKKIMGYEGLKPGEFAEQIGINRSAMSHIMNKRNNPSLDVINRILSRYPYINSDWLLRGEGEMLKIDSPVKPTPIPYAYSKNNPLFGAKTGDTAATPVEDRQQRKTAPPPSPSKSESESESASQHARSEKSGTKPDVSEIYIPVAKKITKLIVVYSDNSFDTFAPESELRVES